MVIFILTHARGIPPQFFNALPPLRKFCRADAYSRYAAKNPHRSNIDEDRRIRGIIRPFAGTRRDDKVLIKPEYDI
jgi:hypothetical protein